MRKFITTAAITAATVFAALSTGCAPTDVYKGDISDEYYSSRLLAVSAFVDNEISGVSRAVFEDYKKTEDMTEADTAVLNLSADQRRRLTAAERGTVWFATDESDEPIAQTVYIMQFGDEYAYYSPALEDGARVTKSYYNSVTSLGGFGSFTLSLEIGSRSSNAADTLAPSFNNTTQRSTIEYAGNVMHVVSYTHLVNDDAKSEYYGNEHEETNEYYYVVDGDRLIRYTKFTDTFFSWEICDVSDLQDIFDSSLGGDDDLVATDHSCFVKTDYGFSLNEAVVKMLLDDKLSALVGDSDVVYDIDGKYIVSGGLMSECELHVGAQVTANGKTEAVSTDTSIKIKKLGSTTIDLPENLPEVS